MVRNRHFVASVLVGVIIGLMLRPGAARAAASPAPTSYTIQSVVKLGDTVGAPPLRLTDYLATGALNDKGQVVFDTNTTSGASAVIRYADGALTPIVRGGGTAPGGQWPRNINIYSTVSMNQAGDVVFASDVTIGGKPSSGTFLWSQQSGQTSPVALQGMPAAGSLVYATGGSHRPVLNSSGEIAFVANVKNAAGQPNRGLFFRGRDGQTQPLMLPDGALPGGGRAAEGKWPSITDAGAVGFVVSYQPGESSDQAYRWESGALTWLAGDGSAIEGGATLAQVGTAYLNEENRNVLISGVRKGDGSSVGEFLLTDGKLQPVAVPGQVMPGGGKFLSRQAFGTSFGNQRGQYVFLADLAGRGTAAYLMQDDGTVSLILQSGAMTNLGRITNVGEGGAGNSGGVGFNNLGQVALTVKIAGVAGDELVVLTPVAP